MSSTTLWSHFEARAELGAPALELAALQILRNGPLSGLIPWVDIPGMTYNFALQDELPKVKARLFDEASERGQGNTVKGAQNVHIYSHDIRTDSSKLALMGQSTHNRQVVAAVQSLRLAIESDFLNGNDALSGGREMDGIRKQIPSSQQLVNASGGAGLKLSKLDELIAEVDGPNDEKVLILPKKLKTKFGAAVRNIGVSGLYIQGIDQLGRSAQMYDGVPLIETDVRDDNLPIQPFTESNNTTTIYCVRMGEGFTSGIQGPVYSESGELTTGLVIYDLPESFNTATRATRFTWHCGAVVEDPNSIASLSGITLADITA
jgi:hypothetical protein